MKNKHTIEWNNKAKTVHLKRLINDTQISDKINRGKKKRERKKHTYGMKQETSYSRRR